MSPSLSNTSLAVNESKNINQGFLQSHINKYFYLRVRLPKRFPCLSGPEIEQIQILYPINVTGRKEFMSRAFTFSNRLKSVA